MDIEQQDVLQSSTLLTPEERQKILFDWNQTYSDYPREKMLHQLFEEQVEKNPDNVALLFENHSLTYRELNAKANQLAHYLKKLGVKDNSLVAICLDPSFDLLIGIIAILKAGGAYVPLDPIYPAERLQYMLEDTQATALITHSSLVNNFKNANTPIVCIDTEAAQIADHAINNIAYINHSENLAYVIYTSGSTGKPKGVMLTHRNVHNFIHWFNDVLPITSHDIFDFSSSISFDFSVPNTVFPLVTGAKIAICPKLDKKDPNLYIKHLLDKQVTFTKLTPSYFRQLKEFAKPDHQFKSLKYILFGGETCIAKDVKEWLAIFPHHQLFNEYGPTEATVATSWMVINEKNINNFSYSIPIGKPVLNSQLYILDNDLEPVGIGELGELYIGGEGLAKGYLNLPDITANKFIKNPFSQNAHAKLYKTGDVCRYLPDGNIEFIERVDHQVKIRGYRIETAEIEISLTTHSAIKEAVVVTRDEFVDRAGEKQLIAYWVPNESNAQLSTNELRQFLQQKLPEYMIPAAFVRIESLPLSPNGKLDRKSLPVPELAHHQFIAPRSELEKNLQKIWSEVLHHNQISIEDNFFELGGHSLSAAQIITKIRKNLNKEIMLQDLYNSPTIGELAIVLSQAKTLNDQSKNQNNLIKNSAIIPLGEMQFIFWLMHLLYPKTKALNVVDRRRISGKINITALKFAFENVLKKHEILSYHIARFFPVQYRQQNLDARLTEEEITHLSSTEKESRLLQSLNELEHFDAWKKSSPLVVARLFYLSNDVSELQICMSHFISDEISPAILFADLSYFYLNFEKKVEPETERIQYKDYVWQELNNMNSTLKQNSVFWEEYLKNITLFPVPTKEIIKHSDLNESSHTSYIEIPENTLTRLQLFSARNRLSISDTLCAAIGLTLAKYLDPDNNNKCFAINFSKSTRDDDIHDQTIGFLVRTDLVKIDLSNNPSFIQLSKNIQKSNAETAHYQLCPGIVKLSYLLKKRWEKKKLRHLMINIYIKLFAKLFPKLKLNEKILMMYGRVFLAGTKQNLLVNVNILNNFVLGNKSQEIDLFGFKLHQINRHKNERIIATNVLDICFERHGQNTAYLIISGNLKPDFRKLIGENILNIISNLSNNS